MAGTHDYDPDDVFYDIETAADAAADEVLEQDAVLREHGYDNVGAAYGPNGETLPEYNPEELI